MKRRITIDEETLGSMLADKRRLDYLETEIDRELDSGAPHSLFRRNQPITRKAIDEILKVHPRPKLGHIKPLDDFRCPEASKTPRWYDPQTVCRCRPGVCSPCHERDCIQKLLSAEIERERTTFDNEAFTRWLCDFEAVLIECGMPQPQAMKFRGEYYDDALPHFAAGDSPDDAAVKQLLAEDHDPEA